MVRKKLENQASLQIRQKFCTLSSHFLMYWKWLVYVIFWPVTSRNADVSCSLANVRSAVPRLFGRLRKYRFWSDGGMCIGTRTVCYIFSVFSVYRITNSAMRYCLRTHQLNSFDFTLFFVCGLVWFSPYKCKNLHLPLLHSAMKTIWRQDKPTQYIYIYCYIMDKALCMHFSNTATTIFRITFSC